MKKQFLKRNFDLKDQIIRSLLWYEDKRLRAFSFTLIYFLMDNYYLCFQIESNALLQFNSLVG